MNNLTIIGNLTRDPELRMVNTKDGQVNVCDFTIAVNKRGGDATFFRVTAWRKAAEIIAKYAKKGSKMYVSGEVGARAYTDKNGEARVSLEVTMNEFEFLSSRGEDHAEEAQVDAPDGFVDMSGTDLPF